MTSQYAYTEPEIEPGPSRGQIDRILHAKRSHHAFRPKDRLNAGYKEEEPLTDAFFSEDPDPNKIALLLHASRIRRRDNNSSRTGSHVLEDEPPLGPANESDFLALGNAPGSRGKCKARQQHRIHTTFKRTIRNIQNVFEDEEALQCEEEGRRKELERLRAATGSDKDAYAIDVLYECQRGFLSFGVPKFSSNALLNLDPKPWAFQDMSPSPYEPHNFPLPDDTWQWLHPQWLVDMTHDVDQEGWAYSFSFYTKGWRSTAKTWRSFVRRRRWVRKRVKPSDRPALPLAPLSAVPDPRLASTEDGAFQYDWHRAAHFDGPLSPTTARDLLPLSEARKSNLISWNAPIDVFNPFLSWTEVRRIGLRFIPKSETEGAEKVQRLWREAVAQVNFVRVSRVLKLCKVDRQRLEMWRCWLGLAKPADAVALPDPSDVRDLLEAHLDALLQGFLYQSTRKLLLDDLHRVYTTAGAPNGDSHPNLSASPDPFANPEQSEAPRLEFYSYLKTMSVDDMQEGAAVKPFTD